MKFTPGPVTAKITWIFGWLQSGKLTVHLQLHFLHLCRFFPTFLFSFSLSLRSEKGSFDRGGGEAFTVSPLPGFHVPLLTGEQPPPRGGEENMKRVEKGGEMRKAERCVLVCTA